MVQEELQFKALEDMTVPERLIKVLEASPYPLAPHEMPYGKLLCNQCTASRELRRMAGAIPPRVSSVWKKKENGSRNYKCWFLLDKMSADVAQKRVDTGVLF
jgi:hypothetical protein